MISIIICSANKNILAEVIYNINHTIGVAFETIIIENSAGKFGISEAYNRGAAKAKFDIFCFMHEDISFETYNWGQKVLSHLVDESVGIIGLAGGDTKSMVPTSWSSSTFESEVSLIQHYRDKPGESKRILKTGYPENTSSIKPVVCLDGLWMCTRRAVFVKYKFDNNTFKGFHGYDVDFSLQVFQEYKNCVVFDILIQHYSDGKYNKTWLYNMMLVSTKWKNTLPVSVRNLSRKEYVLQHWTSMSKFLDYLLLFDYKLSFILCNFFKYSFNRYFGPIYFLHFLKYIFLNYFKEKRSYSNITTA